MTQYDPKNIDKALKRMEDADRLRSIGKQSNNTNMNYKNNSQQQK